MLVPPSSKWVAKACRKEWNETAFRMPARPAAEVKTFSAVEGESGSPFTRPSKSQRTGRKAFQ